MASADLSIKALGLTAHSNLLLCLPLTGVGCVKKIVTNLAVIEVVSEGFKLIERAPGVSVGEIQNATEGHLIIEGAIPEMDI